MQNKKEAMKLSLEERKVMCFNIKISHYIYLPKKL